MSKKDGKFAEDFAENIRNMMETHDLPHINISVENLKTPDIESKTPLTVLSAKIEAVVNILVWDYSAGMLEAGFLLKQLEDQVESLMDLGSYLRLRYDGGTSKKGRANKPGTEGVGNKPEVDESEGDKDVQEPLPQIFSDILKELAKEPISKKVAAAKKVPTKAKAKAKKVAEDLETVAAEVAAVKAAAVIAAAKATAAELEAEIVKKATTRRKIPKTKKEKTPKPTPIPKIFSDTLKEVMDKKKRPGK